MKKPEVSINEVIDYVFEQLVKEGYVPEREIIKKVFDLEDEFLYFKGKEDEKIQ